MHGTFLLVGFLVSLAAPVPAVVAVEEDAPPWKVTQDLISSLMTSGYDKRALPVESSQQPVNVNYGLFLLGFDNIDEKRNTITTRTLSSMTWRDPRLAWNTSQYPGQNVRLLANEVWIPDIEPYNAVGSSRYYPAVSISLFPFGTCYSLQYLTLETTCTLDLRYFPFDTQTCSLEFGSWTYNILKLNLTTYSVGLDVSYFSEHANWRLVSHKGGREEKTYSCCPEPYVSIKYNLVLARKSTYYVYMYVVPPVMLSLLIPFIFLLPLTGAHRPLHGAVTTISMTLLIGTFDLVGSRGFSEVPLLAIFYMGVLVVSIMVTLLACLVSWIASRAGSDLQPPSFLSRIVGTVLAKVMLVSDEVLPPSGGISIDAENMAVSEKKPGDAETERASRAAEWRKIATTLDRIFFIVFAVIIFLMGILLHQKI